jgi:hypothetical protein
VTRMRVLVLLAALGVVAGVGSGAFFLGERMALNSLSIVEATPDQLAAAMRNDHFYADYNEHTLLVHGLVASVASGGGGGELQFQTKGAFTTSCAFDQYPGTVHAGDTIVVVAEGATAERLTSGVRLKECQLLGG